MLAEAMEVDKEQDKLIAEGVEKDKEHDRLLEEAKATDEKHARMLAEAMEADKEQDKLIAEGIEKDKEHDELLIEQTEKIKELYGKIEWLETELSQKGSKNLLFITTAISVVSLVMVVVQFIG